MVIRLSILKIIVINIPMAIWKSLRISIIKRWKFFFTFLSGFDRFPIYLQVMKKAHSHKYKLLSKYAIKFKCYSRYMYKKICLISCPSLEKTAIHYHFFVLKVLGIFIWITIFFHFHHLTCDPHRDWLEEINVEIFGCTMWSIKLTTIIPVDQFFTRLL